MVIRDDVLSIVVTFTDKNVIQKDLFTPHHHKWLCYIHNTTTDIHRSFSYQCNGKTNPVAKDALFCLLQDYDAGEMSFEDFCWSFGYSHCREDYDSRKEFGKIKSMYNAVVKNRRRVQDLFNEKQIEHLKDLVGEE